jgi:hypothetical protein
MAEAYPEEEEVTVTELRGQGERGEEFKEIYERFMI